MKYLDEILVSQLAKEFCFSECVPLIGFVLWQRLGLGIRLFRCMLSFCGMNGSAGEEEMKLPKRMSRCVFMKYNIEGPSYIITGPFYRNNLPSFTSHSFSIVPPTFSPPLPLPHNQCAHLIRKSIDRSSYIKECSWL